jgi:hypothetical protein
MAVKIDIIDGNSGSFTRRGWELTRIAIVDGLTGNPWEMIPEAVLTVTATYGIQIGSPHPFITTAFVDEIIPGSISTAGNQVRTIRLGLLTFIVNSMQTMNILLRLAMR